jgi:hypothetical protein
MRFIVSLLLALSSAPLAQTPPQPSIGSTAPAFSLPDDRGQLQALGAYAGKIVVLEWHSNECPYVAKHYRSGHMQALQRDWTAKGIAWFVIESAGPGQPGFVTPEQSIEYMRVNLGAPTAVLHDPTGEVGHLYGAKTTLHMAVIDRAGRLAYLGAIDDKPSTEAADIPRAKNYVEKALTDLIADRPVATSSAPPYGCTIFYVKRSAATGR